MGRLLGLVAVMRNPALRADLSVRQMSSSNESYVIVKDPETQEYYKFEDWEHDLFELLDGTRNIEQLAEQFGAQYPQLDVDTQWMVDYVEGLRVTGLLERSDQERHLVMMDKLKTLRRKRLYQVHSIFQINFPLFDPDEMMNRIMPWIRWVWSPWHVLFWIGAFTVVIGFLFYHWTLYWTGFFGLFDPRTNTAWDFVGLVLVIFSIGIWHELGHGLTCKAFGGEVHDIGLMVYYFEPAFYCGIDDSYLFPKLSHRIYCALGGPYFELMLCSVAMVAWLWTPAEWWIHNLALTIVFVSGISVLFNANPLLKLDGYFVLMDWLDVPELREESFKYMGNLFRKRVFHLSVTEEPISRRRRRIYLTYGIVSILYTALVLYLIVNIARNWLVGWLGPMGYLVLFGLLLFLMRRKLVQVRRLFKHFWLDKREWLMSPRGGGSAALVVVLLAVVLFVPRTATRIEASFTVEPGQRNVVRAPAGAVIRQVNVSEGMVVERGQVLARLENTDLEAQGRLAAADHDTRLRLAREARREGDIVSAQGRNAEAAEAAIRVRLLERRQDELVLVAPQAGLVTTADRILGSAQGRYIEQGDAFCEIDRLETVRLSISALESDIEEISDGVEVRMLAAAHPGRTLRASVRGVSPVANPPRLDEGKRLDLVQRVNLVRVLVEVDNPDRRLLPGMSGRVQFLTTPRSPAGKIWRGLSRWGSTIVW